MRERNFRIIDDKGTIMFIEPDEKVESPDYIEHHLFKEWCGYWRRAEEVKGKEGRQQIKGILVELLMDLYKIEKKAKPE